MRRTALLLLALAALPALRPAALTAQTDRATVVVTAVDSAGQPVPGVRVDVSGVTHPAISDVAGQATVSGIPFGNRLVTIGHPSFREERVFLQLQSAEPFRLRAVLSPALIALDTLLVEGERFTPTLHRAGFYSRRRQGQGKHFTREELERLTGIATDLAPALRQIPGFSVERGADGGPFVLQSSRGARSLQDGGCTPIVRIDGVRADPEELALLAPVDVEAIEAYPNAASAPLEYTAAGSACGVVLVWLRR